MMTPTGDVIGKLLDSRDLIKHAGLFFCHIVYAWYDITSMMFLTDDTLN
jgi:hypothetical protein